MAYTEDVNVNLNVLAGAMGGITAIMGGMSALTSTFGQFGTEAANSFGTFDSLIVGSTVLVASFGVKAAEAFGEFEQGMKIVQTVSNQSGAAISELSDKANEMSITYRTAIGDITDGLQTLGRAGLNSATTQLEVLESGLQTAKLEGRNLNGVLEELIQNTAMLGGDLKSVDFGAQTEQLNTLMVGTSMTAPINSHDISQTLQYAGGTAAAAGANLENAESKKKLDDLMGTIAAFAQKGVKGSMAGTALRAFFTKPASQDASVTEGLSRIGLKADDLWENGGQSMKSVSDQIGIIQRQMDHLHMSQMDRIEVWGKIVGAKMGQQMMKLDSSSIKDLTRDIEGAASAESLATKTLHTYTQKISEMQQQGELAFREFGQKAVVFLTPIIEVITKIFALLSNPVVNFGVFAVAGALVSHGIRKIWGMITAVFAELKSLFGQAVQGIQTINSLAGGSVPGFEQSAASVDILNTRLAQTNQELMLMQARFMNIHGTTATGTYVAPLGIVDKNGKLPANMVGTAMQDVLWRPGGKYGGQEVAGKFYDPSHEAQFRSDFKKQLMAENDAKINSAVQSHYNENTQRYHALPGGRGQFIKKEDLLNDYRQKMTLSPKDIEAQTNAAVKAGKGQVHSSLMSLTESEYKKLTKSWDAAEERLKNTNNYIDEKTGKFDAKKYQADQLKAFNKQYNAEMDPKLAKNTVNGVNFRRALVLQQQKERFFGDERVLQKQAQLEEQERIRANKINPQQTSLNQRASAVTQNRLNSINKALSTTTKSVTNFGSKLQTSVKRSLFGKPNEGSTVKNLFNSLPNMVTKFEAQAMASLEKINVGTTSFNEGLIQLREACGLNAAEFETLWTTSTELQTAFLELYGITTEDAAVSAEDVMAKRADAAATLADMTAKEADAAATSGGMLSKIGGGISSVVGYMGGPFMAGMMAITGIMQGIQASQRAWQEEMQEATQQLSEAQDQMSTAMDSIKDIYKSENSDMTEADLDKAVDEQFATIDEAFYGGNHIGHYETNRDDLGRANFDQDIDMSGKVNEETGKYEMLTEEQIAEQQESVEEITLAKDENIKALNENTMALVEAVAAYNKAQNKEAKSFDDPSWGARSITADFTDFMGEMQESLWNVGSWGEGVDRREGFLDSNSPVLTGSQADSNYAGSTEFAAIMAMDVSRFGVEKGLQQFFGSDYDRIISLMGSMDNKMGQYGSMGGYATLQAHAKNMADMDSRKMAQAQMFMKNQPETVQMLGKQMFRYEQQRGLKSGHTAFEDWSTGTLRQRVPGTRKGDKNAYKEIAKAKWTVQDKNLDRTLKKIMSMTDNKLSYANVLAMGQLQQLQDMYTVATEAVAPGIMQTVQGVYNNVSATGAAGANAGSAAGGAASAAANAAAIAAILGAEAQSKAEGAAYDEWKRDENAPQTINGVTITDQDSFVKAISKGGEEGNKWQSKIFQSLSGGGWSLNHPGASPEMIKQNAERLAGMDSDLMKSNASYQDKLNTATNMIVQYAQGATLAAYDQSNIGEYGGGDRGTPSGGGGGGGDGGGGGGGSDTGNSGTKKERVDLVLCNKKEIPKLNVNLFKKPPNFTVLNKNFKVRDIKINSQDKPKAIMNAVKNGIIETQKRMDPKIIQDEEAVYDPVAASDGKSTSPSGTTKTTSDKTTT